MSMKEDERKTIRQHVWFFEPKPVEGVLTQDGVSQIIHHEYKPGTYTYIDTVLNPFWQALTDLLPMWVAPNLLTATGFLCCLVSYLVTMYYNFGLESDVLVPEWVIVFNGVALMAYYTLDCMDGKQARRTRTSSPLGQLFDHGVDCLGTICHVSLAHCIVCVAPYQLLWLQCALQFAFFQAQWEEYYTGVLPHGTGNVGVTEVNYGMGLWSILTGVLVKRDTYDGILPQMLQDIPFPLRSVVLEDIDLLQVRHILVLGWIYLIIGLSTLSMIRVAKHLQSVQSVASAYSKLASPAIACASALTLFPHDEIRFQSICLGLCMCMMTIKMIVFSMGKMSFATIQGLDLFPVVMVAIAASTFAEAAKYMFPLFAMGYLLRLLYWTHAAIDQLCSKLDIMLFRIKPKTS